MTDRPHYVTNLFFPSRSDPVEMDSHLSALIAGQLTLPYDALVPLALLTFVDAENELFSEEESAVIIESMENCWEWTMHPLKVIVSCALLKASRDEQTYEHQIPQDVYLTFTWLKGMRNARC